MKKEYIIIITIGFVLSFLIGFFISANFFNQSVTTDESSNEPQSAPSLSWTINDATDEITISAGSSSHNYGASNNDGNLIFKNGDTTYYVNVYLYLTLDNSVSLSTATISAGDVIQGFFAGTWQVIWEPTNTLLGTIDFTGPAAPSLSWTIDDANDIMTISAGSSSSYYAASSTDGNLVFKLGFTKYYVKTDLSLSSSQTGLYTGLIQAGDTITGFSAGTWQVIWEPTDKLLGTITFS